MAERLDFDNPWKELIQLFFRPFMEFYYPEQARQIDWTKGFEFLEQELRQILREADTGLVRVDKLVKVWLLDGGEKWILIHLEIQSQASADFAERTYTYHNRVRDFYGVPVASLALLADEEANWRPTGYHYQLLGCRVDFHFAAVKLLDFESRLTWLEEQNNPFAVATLAHLQTLRTRRDSSARQRWKLRLVKSLYQRSYGRQEILELFRFIDWLMILPADLKESFRVELETFEREKKMPYLSSYERDAIEKGRNEGQVEQGRALLYKLLSHRFGSLESGITDKLKTLSPKQQEHLAEALLDFRSIADLENWLSQNKQS